MFKIKRRQKDDAPARRTVVNSGTAMRTTVFSYHANRSARPDVSSRNEATGDNTDSASEAAIADRSAPKRPMLLRRTTFFLVIGVALVVAVINIPLKGSPKIVIENTTSSGKVFLRSTSTYQAAAQSATANSFFNNNKLTVNTNGIASDLRKQFPELTRVNVSVPFIGNQVVVHMQPATPQLLLSAGSSLYVIDEMGRALMDAKQVPNVDKLGLPVVTDQSGMTLNIGKVVLPSASVNFITEVYGQLKANKINVISLVLPAGTNELDVKVEGAPYFVKYNLRGNGRVEAGAYLAVKKQLEREKKTPTAYIDVRAEDRAYYK